MTTWRVPRYLFLVLMLAVPVQGCGSDSTGPDVTYVNIAGTYAGTITATTQYNGAIVYLNSDFSMILNQNGSNLSGTDSGNGTISDGFGNSIAIGGTNNITGTVGSGSNPSVTVTEQNLDCPNQNDTWHLQYANRLITGTMQISIFDNSCSTVMTFSNISVALRAP